MSSPLRALPRKQVVLTMAGVMLALFLGSLDQTVVGTAMPQIISQLGGFSHYTWVTTAYLVASTTVIPITGKLTDMYGRKIFYLIGLGIFTAGSLFSGLSQTMTQIIIFRAIQGVGAGISIANAFTVIADLFPPVERGKYQGLLSTVFGLAAIIGPTLGGFLTDQLSWHWVFFINIPLGILVIVLFILFFPELRPEPHRHRVDYAGAVTMVLTVVPALLALSWGGVEYPWLSPEVGGLFALAAIMGVVFFFVEKRSPEPIIPFSLFQNPIVSVAQVLVFVSGFAMFGVVIFIPLFFQGVLGFSATASGTFLTPMMLGVVAGSIFSGQMLSRHGGHYKILGGVGLVIAGIGMGMFAMLTPGSSYGGAVFNIIFLGFGLGMTMTPYNVAVQNAVSRKMLGVASSSTPFFRSIGGSMGLAVLGSIMNNQFAMAFLGALPASVRSLIPPDRLALLAENPRVLVSPQAQAQLQGMLSDSGSQGALLYEPVIEALRQGLNIALSRVFLVGLAVIIIAFVLNLFLKEIPLQRGEAAPDELPRSGGEV